MIDITKDMQPPTTSRNHSVEFMQQLKTTQRPIILTVNGKPEAGLQGAAAYQGRLDIAAKADACGASAWDCNSLPTERDALPANSPKRCASGMAYLGRVL